MNPVLKPTKDTNLKFCLPTKLPSRKLKKMNKDQPDDVACSLAAVPPCYDDTSCHASVEGDPLAHRYLGV